LRSLAFQLYGLRPESQKDLDGLFTSHNSGKRQPNTRTLSSCLKDMMRAPKRVFILLDALDECSERKMVLEWMQESIPVLAHVQVIATGRPEAELERTLPGWIGKQNCLPLNKESVNTDIQSYIKVRLDQGQEFKRWAGSPGVLEQIRDTVGSKADGM
jgi:hypothetical protein